jgi:hypothetical protein
MILDIIGFKINHHLFWPLPLLLSFALPLVSFFFLDLSCAFASNIIRKIFLVPVRLPFFTFLRKFRKYAPAANRGLDVARKSVTGCLPLLSFLCRPNRTLGIEQD